ncbi:hypothetical protein FRC17_004689 [Serendipita sp. 399]|nr:hypothetical protein FRC17_004689 [Serendipita sp. 399]
MQTTNPCEESATANIPTEIWWNILEYSISSEYFFACIFSDDDDWASFSEDYRSGPTLQWEYEQSKQQIKIISMVCKSWRHFSEAVTSRFLHVNERYAQNPNIDVPALAWRVHIVTFRPYLFRFEGRSVDWRVLSTMQDLAKDFEMIPHPKLRRLDLRYSTHEERVVDSNSFIQSLSPFTNITWFSYFTAAIASPDCLEDDNGPKITLPKLQVFQYHGVGGFHLPFYRLDLPSLQHIAIIANFNPKTFPIWHHVVDLYGKTLHSIYIKPFCGGLVLKSQSHPYFPSWDRVPHLRQLALCAPISLGFYPLPATHPLRIFTGQIWAIDDLSHWLDSVSLKKIRMVHAYRGSDGGLAHEGKRRLYLKHLPDISSTEVERLLAKAASKGILLQVGSEKNWHPVE